MPVTGAVAIDDEASTVCWGAVIAGGVAAAAVTLVLLAFGVGVGFSVVSPWADQGVSSTTFHIGAGIYLIVVAMLASTIGGYLAGRLRARWSTVHEHEIYFRDTAHGFLAWALATVLSATVMGAATTHILARPQVQLRPQRPPRRGTAGRPISTSTVCCATTRRRLPARPPRRWPPAMHHRTTRNWGGSSHRRRGRAVKSRLPTVPTPPRS
jgi:hypothetical protein